MALDVQCSAIRTGQHRYLFRFCSIAVAWWLELHQNGAVHSQQFGFFSGSCHSHRHCRLLRQGDATKQFLLRLCLSFLSVSHACLGVGANLEVRFNLDPFGKKSDEDLLGDNLCKFEEGARALLADLRGMLQLQELWEAFAEFTASPASVTEVDSIWSPLVSLCFAALCCALPLSCVAVASSE